MMPTAMGCVTSDAAVQRRQRREQAPLMMSQADSERDQVNRFGGGSDIGGGVVATAAMVLNKGGDGDQSLITSSCGGRHSQSCRCAWKGVGGECVLR